MRILLVFVPTVLSFIIQKILPIHFDEMERVYFQPPSYVFAIVWTFLYIMLGVYLYRLDDYILLSLFTMNLFVNLMWTPIVNIMKQYIIGIYLIGIMLLTTLLIIILESNKINKSLLIPYVVWLLYALLLNIELARIYNKN